MRKYVKEGQRVGAAPAPSRQKGAPALASKGPGLGTGASPALSAKTFSGATTGAAPVLKPNLLEQFSLRLSLFFFLCAQLFLGPPQRRPKFIPSTWD